MKFRRLVSGADLWDAPDVVEAYRGSAPVLRWYDAYLINCAVAELGRHTTVHRLHAIGCGGGRELPAVRATFPQAEITASDPSPAMVAACRTNLAAWGCEDRVTVHCCPATRLPKADQRSELVLALDNVLTYVTPELERIATLRDLRAQLAPGGLLAGTVHHRRAGVAKSAFFLARSCAHRLGLVHGDPGDRILVQGGRAGRIHYFTASELDRLFHATGFRPLMVSSLAQVARRVGRRYSALRGANNLVYLAVAN